MSAILKKIQMEFILINKGERRTKLINNSNLSQNENNFN